MAYTTINDPSAHFQTVLWTGNAADGSGGQTQAITFDGNSDMQPDWVWVKQRSHAAKHHIVDSSRGVSQRIVSNNSDGEDDQGSNNGVYQFNSDGFNVGTFGRGVNDVSKTYVAWCWKANGATTTTNDASATSVGTIDSVYQANTSAGFSIVTWTGTGSNGSIAHGLGVVPDLIISKSRGHAENWAVYHKNSNSTPEDYYLALDDTRAATDSAVVWNDTAPTSTVISIGTQDKINKSGSTHIAYCFNEIKGYSKFGSYTANGNASGPFVYTGFKPALIIIKRTDGAGNDWRIMDHKRDPDNIVEGRIKPNTTAAEDTNDQLDFLSNGFKLRATAGDLNGTDGHTFIYIAFAETPFVSSTGTPTTAR